MVTLWWRHGGIKATNRILAVDKDMKPYNTPEFRLIQDSIGAFTTRSYEKFLPTSDVAGQVRMIKWKNASEGILSKCILRYPNPMQMPAHFVSRYIAPAKIFITLMLNDYVSLL